MHESKVMKYVEVKLSNRKNIEVQGAKIKRVEAKHSNMLHFKTSSNFFYLPIFKENKINTLEKTMK